MEEDADTVIKRFFLSDCGLFNFLQIVSENFKVKIDHNYYSDASRVSENCEKKDNFDHINIKHAFEYTVIVHYVTYHFRNKHIDIFFGFFKIRCKLFRIGHGPEACQQLVGCLFANIYMYVLLRDV